MWWPNLGCQPVLVSLSLVPARFTLILNSFFFKGERSPHVMAPDLDPRRERLPPTKPEKRESPALFQMSVATDRKGWCVKCVQETTTTQQKEEELLKKETHKLDDPTGWARFWNWLKMLNGPPHILWPFYDRPCYIDRGGVISASNMSQLFAERGTRQKWLGYDSIAAEWRRPVLYTQSRPFGALLRCRSFVTRRGEKENDIRFVE